MPRVILEKTTLATGDDLITTLQELAKYVGANTPAIITAFDTSKTAVSTVATDAATTSATEFTSATGDFVNDAVVADDYVTILKSDEEANIGTWRVTSRVSLTELVLDATLVADSSMTFTVDRVRHVRHSIGDLNIFFLP